MTVHCIEIMASTDVNAENVKNKIANLKDDYGEKVPKDNSSLDEKVDLDTGTKYYTANFRVTLSEDNKTTKKDDFTEQIRKEMDKSASWWQLRWHECDHDTQGSDCDVNQYRNDNENVPPEVRW